MIALKEHSKMSQYKKQFSETKSDKHDMITDKYCDPISCHLMKAPVKLGNNYYDKSTLINIAKMDNDGDYYVIDPLTVTVVYISEFVIDETMHDEIENYVKNNWALIYNPVVMSDSHYGPFYDLTTYIDMIKNDPVIDVNYLLSEYFRICAAQELIKEQYDEHEMNDYKLCYNNVVYCIGVRLRELFINKDINDLFTMYPYHKGYYELEKMTYNYLIIATRQFQYDFIGNCSYFINGNSVSYKALLLESLIVNRVHYDVVCQKAYDALPEPRKDCAYEIQQDDILMLALSYRHYFTIDKYIDFMEHKHKCYIYNNLDLIEYVLSILDDDEKQEFILDGFYKYDCVNIVNRTNAESFHDILCNKIEKLFDNCSLKIIFAVIDAATKIDTKYWRTIINSAHLIKNQTKKYAVVSYVKHNSNQKKRKREDP